MNIDTPIWYPFTQMATAEEPLEVVSGHGSHLTLADGRSLIDGIGSWWVSIHGHTHPHLIEALHLQAQRLEHVIFAGFVHEPALKLATGLLNKMPYMDKVFYSDDGSTAVEVALKIAIQYLGLTQAKSQKVRILALEGAYHGDTFGAMSIGARSTFNVHFESYLFEVMHLPLPTLDNIKNIMTQLETYQNEGGIDVFIYEPLVQGAAGMRIYPSHCLELILEQLKSQGTLLIADEVMTGFYRTGTFLASDKLTNLKPDIVCLSKALTGGMMPLGATVCSRQIYEPFHSDDIQKTLYHGHSYTANPLACACGVASLELFEDTDYLQNITRISNRLAQFVRYVNQKHPHIKATTLGLVLALEWQNAGDSGYFNDLKAKLYNYAIQKGVLLRPLGNVLYTLPSLSTTDEELETILEVLDSAATLFNHGH